MAISTQDFWRLLAESGLLSSAEGQQLQERFSAANAADDQGAATALAEWLVAERAVTRYQANVLLSGRAGPFVYGSYVLRKRIKSGRFSGCFRGVHVATRHPVLLWFLSGPSVQDAQSYGAAVAQLEDSCRAIYPFLYRAYQLVDLGSFKFVALEELAGATAADALAGTGRLGPRAACRVMRQIALAAEELHSRGVVHGEIRPDNVWIDASGQGRLLQLPVSREPHLAPSMPNDPTLLEETRAIVADYAAPELAFGDCEPDALSDVYAIGCTLYQLLNGQPPFAGGSAAEKMKRHAAEAIKPLEPLGVPAELAKVVAFAMAKDRKLRFQSAALLAEALAVFIDSEAKGAVPRSAPTSAAFEEWLRTQPLVPQIEAFAHSTQTRFDVSAVDSQGSSAELDLHGPNDDSELAFVATTSATTSATAKMRAQRKRARNQAIFALALLCALGIGGGIGYLMRDPNASLTPNGDFDGETRVAGGGNLSQGGPPEDHEGDAHAGKDESSSGREPLTVPDDGRTLWVSPTDGAAISWAYLPPRAEIALALRPAELLHHPEGEKLLAALGPHGALACAAAEQDVAMPLSEIEELTIAWTNLGGDWTATYVVRPAVKHTPETLAAKWQQHRPAEHGSERYFVAGERAYWAPTVEQGARFVVSAAAQMPERIDAGSGTAPLMRDMFKLLQTSDSERGATLLFTRNALLVDAKPAFSAAGLERLPGALAWLVRNDCKAAAISLHLAENCYLEARAIGNAQTTTTRELAATFQERMKRLAVDVEDNLSRIGFQPYSSKVLLRLGSMARFVEQQLRVDAEDDQVVINGYLPAIAAHNLALAAELAIAQPRTDAVPVAPAESPATTNEQSIADKLQKTMSLSFERETLERAIELLSDEVGAPMEILGGDLQLEGITKNQSFGLHEIDQPAGEILRKVMLQANPGGKLVYVIKPASPGGEQRLFVTTRAAAEQRRDRLPPELDAAAADNINAQQ